MSEMGTDAGDLQKYFTFILRKRSFLEGFVACGAYKGYYITKILYENIGMPPKDIQQGGSC
jgi:hypothetical protein